ncbi:MAG: hypothetical protein EOP52_07850 [Sphingobacteriales bacterium]|nr:MAG: hypothetical protein EOP52_07850 [Sphingobacteriales bacterium]
MHEIEPFFNWRHLYTAEEDEQSPFYGRDYSEFEYSNTVYNYFIHPQWDAFESSTLYLKILYADYDLNYCIIELIGEWNDAVENDIMMLKRNVIDPLLAKGIQKFILICENVLNFHSSDVEYYAEWKEDVEDGWIIILNAPDQTRREFLREKIGHYLLFGDVANWRTFQPQHFFQLVDNQMLRLT